MHLCGRNVVSAHEWHFECKQDECGVFSVELKKKSTTIKNTFNNLEKYPHRNPSVQCFISVIFEVPSGCSPCWLAAPVSCFRFIGDRRPCCVVLPLLCLPVLSSGLLIWNCRYRPIANCGGWVLSILHSCRSYHCDLQCMWVKHSRTLAINQYIQRSHLRSYMHMLDYDPY